MLSRAILLFTTLATSLFGLSSTSAALEVGSPAPQVSAPDQSGTQVHFSDVYKKGLALVYFYPKADTPGCTAQACSLRDAFTDLTGRNLHILGVSRDSVEAQKKFRDQFQIPFPLISDSDGKVAKAFRVPSLLGLPFSRRQSFLIKNGVVAWISPRAKTKDHAAEVQAAIDALSAH